jgi:hypothetical protein
MSVIETVENLNARLRTLENRFSELGYDMTSLVQSEFKRRWKIQPQSETQFGLFTALCVDTIDPWKQNRVRFFSPLFHKPDTPVKSLPFAAPVSAAGGFDDSGMTWVPPAGSTLCILFENGSRATPYYIGTTWHRDRGPDGEHNWGYNIDEYYKIHEGHRKGYNVGADDGSQVHAPWNTQNYNGNDIDSLADFENDPEAQRKITYPHIYGFKTNQKHMIKLDDGDYKCNHKGKKIEILSSGGIWMCFKDDHLHDASVTVHPSCGAGGSELVCSDEDGNPKEKTECEGENSNSSILGGHPSTPEGTTHEGSNTGSNPYHKHKQECRPYKGPGTPQNNKAMLPQSGWQVLTPSGQTVVLDDSVEEPSGIPEWERSTEDFDFGCNNKFLGRILVLSATGHKILVSDEESDSQLRGEKNGIFLQTAGRNMIALNDHTVGKKDCPGSPPNVGGNKRGIFLVSDCNHHFMMVGEDNEYTSPCRKADEDVEYNSEFTSNTPRAKKGFIRARTGYGLEILMKDDDSQEETKQQHIQIFCPQRDNSDRGPHILRMQESADGPGMVFLRVGGNYICSIYDNHYTIIGDKEENPADKITVVSKNTVIQSEQFYFNQAEIHALLAKRVILLMAGEDCEGADGAGACIYPVLVFTPAGVKISDRVFGSASNDAACVSIFHLTPFHNCGGE